MKPKSSNSAAGRTFAGARLLGNICELHKKKEIMRVNTCPVCLMHIHKHACKERDKLRAVVEWIAAQQNLFFAECTQAEEIVSRCREALKQPNTDVSDRRDNPKR